MSPVTDFSQLSQDDVDQAEAYILQILQEACPSFDLGYGRVLHQILVRPAAILQALMAKNEELYNQSYSLLQVSEDPDSADATIVDGLMSNFRITRNEGSQGSGNVTFILSQGLSLNIPQGFELTANGMTFSTYDSYSIVTDSTLDISTTDRLMIARLDGTFQFTIPVLAQEVGTAGKLKKNDILSVVLPPEGFIQAYAESDFAGGDNAETNAELSDKAALGISARILAGRSQIESLLKDSFSYIQQLSIIGYGDTEMLRDRHNIFSTSTGGCVDIYARTEAFPLIVESIREATLIDKTNGIWQISFSKSELPAMYKVSYVQPEEGTVDGSYEITSQVKSLDLSASGSPDLVSLVEGAFTAYQTTILQFIDTATGTLSVQDKRSYRFGVLQMPNIDLIQEFVSDRENTNPNASYLVRAAIPCQVSVSMQIQRRRTDPSIDIESLKNALRDAINEIGFGVGRLEGTLVTGTVDALLPGKAMIDSTSLELRGEIVKTDGTSEFLFSDRLLEIPDLPEEAITSNTCIFTCDTNSIGITVITVED